VVYNVQNSDLCDSSELCAEVREPRAPRRADIAAKLVYNDELGFTSLWLLLPPHETNRPLLYNTKGENNSAYDNLVWIAKRYVLIAGSLDIHNKKCFV
jgi:hypothetical protein